MSFKNGLKWLWIVMLVSSVIACSAAGTSGGSPDEGTKGESQDETYTVTFVDSVSRDAPPKNGKGIELINERFNIDYQPSFTPSTDYEEKQATLFASGEIPDMIGFDSPDGNFFKWAEQGAFLPLNDFIDDYPTLKMVPDYSWDAVSVDGNIYALPRYFPTKYLRTPVIRKDWLDNLGLDMPTNYEELKEVAIAFTKDDPNGNGKDDTYGLIAAAGGGNINPDYAFGTYWDANSWYHENDDGQLIPGFLSDAYKEHIQWLHDVNEAGAIHPDYATADAYEALELFYSGKIGIFTDQPYNRSSADYESLSEIDPEAEIVAIPPFEAPDGSKAYTASSGIYQLTAFSAKLANEPDKVKRILEMLDFARQWHDLEDRNPKNEAYDWLKGHEGSGYHMEDGMAIGEPASEGLAPSDYITERPWAPNDEANRSSETYQLPLQQKVAASLEKMHAENDHYLNPINRVYSETFMSKGPDLYQEVYKMQVKMIAGQVPISEWDSMVQHYLKKGGSDIIQEVNEAMKANNITGEWLE